MRVFFFFKQKTAYEMRISDWSSDVCSSDLLASSVGGAGSAYGYGYASLGELPAWVIGWMLLCEYMVAIPAVATGWSGYVVNFLQSLGSGLPDFLTHGPIDKLTPGLINQIGRAHV